MAVDPWRQLERDLKALQRRWPRRPLSKPVRQIFQNLRVAVKNFREGGQTQSAAGQGKTFSFVPLIQRLLKEQDVLFLNRKLSYHVVAPADLPEAYGSSEEAMAVLGDLLSVAVRSISFEARVDIALQSHSHPDGEFLRVQFSFLGEALNDQQRLGLIQKLYGADPKGFHYAKNILRRVGGHFWLAFPKEKALILSFTWPTFERPALEPSTHYGTYQYDIWLTDYPKIRQRFGIPKSEKLVSQIESFVRSLVRQPLDVVLAFPRQGLTTAIYEAGKEGASSVASRLSQRLGREVFRIGQKNISPRFRYRLTFLS